MRYSTVIAGLLTLASTAVHGRSTYHLEPLENLRHVPNGWKEVGAPVQTRKLHFRIAVHQVSYSFMYSSE